MLDNRVSGFLVTLEAQTMGDAIINGWWMGKQVGSGRIIFTDYETYMVS